MSEYLNSALPAQFSIGIVLRHTFAVIRSDFSGFAAIVVALILFRHIPVLLVDRASDGFSWWNFAVMSSGKYIIGGCADAVLIYGAFLALSGSKPSLRDLGRGLSFAIPVMAVLVMIDLPSLGSTLLEVGNPGQYQARIVQAAIATAGYILYVLVYCSTGNHC